jgi:arylformamidase
MALSTSTHLGTHLDAPFHYSAEGERLGGVPLEVLLGEARVIDARAGVTPALLTPFPTLSKRVLLFTGEPAHWETFPEDFSPLTPELIHALADRGVKARRHRRAERRRADQQRRWPAHRACLERGVLLVEGLNLQSVAEGVYDLICLPLNLPDADASPVRAILR